MAVTTVVKTVGTTGAFSTPQLWEDGAPANLTTSNNWAAGTFVGTFIQGEAVTGVGITGGKFLDSDGSSYITFGTTTTPATGITVTGTTSLATCVLSGSANVGVIWQGQQQNQEFSGTGIQLSIAGSTVSSTCYKEYTTAAGASFADNANKLTNALCYNASNGAAIRGTSSNTATVVFNEASAHSSKLQYAATGAGGRGFGISGGALQFHNSLIIEGTYVATSTTLGVAYVVSSATISNSLIIQRASAADHIVATGVASPFFYGCTLVAADDLATAPVSVFLSGASGTVTVQNCGMFAGGDKPTTAGSATFNFTTCYGDDSTPATGITTATYISEFENVTNAASDFREKVGAAQTGTGTTDAVNAPTDIVGTVRVAPYDVGVWQLPASSSAIKTWNGVANASVKTVGGIARAAVKTWNGIA